VIEEMWDVQAGGRHALDEDAIQTPIFHALKRGGRRRHQQEGATASLEEFRRDPLTAPIPIQALAPVPTRHTPSTREWTGSAPQERSAHRVRSAAAHRERSSSAQREWLDSVQREATQREATQRESSASASREWLGLTALAERGRHRLAPANW
jgi:hypothetical protein